MTTCEGAQPHRRFFERHASRKSRPPTGAGGRSGQVMEMVVYAFKLEERQPAEICPRVDLRARKVLKRLGVGHRARGAASAAYARHKSGRFEHMHSRATMLDAAMTERKLRVQVND